MEDLRNGEEKAKKNRKGLHKSETIKLPTFNDVSGGKGKKVDATKAKTLFEFLKDEAHLSGVIELVLNGSRFKVRFHQQNVMAILVLDGVRCLPNDGEYAKVSEEALNFSKANYLQRDFEVRLKRVDIKGVYHGIVTVGKKDVAADLLENGLAVTLERNRDDIYLDIEKEARKKQVGLWKYNLNLEAFKGEV